MARFARMPIKNNLQKECCTTSKSIIALRQARNKCTAPIIRSLHRTYGNPRQIVSGLRLRRRGRIDA